MSWLVPKRFKLIFRTLLDFLTDALDDVRVAQRGQCRIFQNRLPRKPLNSIPYDCQKNVTYHSEKSHVSVTFFVTFP